MKPIQRRLVLALAAATVALAAPFGAFAQNKVNLGVAIPSADHGFTGGIVWWANEAKKELEKKYPDLKVTVKTGQGRRRAGQPAAGPGDGQQDQRAGDLPARVGRADQAGASRCTARAST